MIGVGLVLCKCSPSEDKPSFPNYRSSFQALHSTVYSNVILLGNPSLLPDWKWLQMALPMLILSILFVSGSSTDKESASNAGDPDLIPELGRYPGEGNNYPLQNSCQFQSEFGNKEFMIWATVSSWSCFCWLYRASPSLAAKNIINLISVLTIWWCPCVESSLVLLEECASFNPNKVPESQSRLSPPSAGPLFFKEPTVFLRKVCSPDCAP